MLLHLQGGVAVIQSRPGKQQQKNTALFSLVYGFTKVQFVLSLFRPCLQFEQVCRVEHKHSNKHNAKAVIRIAGARKALTPAIRIKIIMLNGIYYASSLAFFNMGLPAPNPGWLPCFSLRINLF